MRNKGFTLVELLAVIVILLIIFLLVFPSVQKILFKSKETISNKQIDTILNASYDFSLQNMSILPELNNKSYITLAQLKSNGLVEVNITNPETKKLYPNDLVISIENVGSGYKNSGEYSKLKGDYLYTIMLNQLTGLSEDKLPKIKLDPAFPKNSKGEYIDEVDINTSFNVDYSAESSDGTDLTSRVYVSITFKDNSVSEIDTSKLGIYKIQYTVVDDFGYSKNIILNVIITDNDPPVLTLPENNTIDTSVTEFDLMNGVICTDNSGVCNITTSGIVKFGEIGKYPIIYTAQDSSGNTITLERIITIE